MKKFIVIQLAVFLVNTGIWSQGFIDVTTAQGIGMINNGNSLLGVGLSFYDFDKDGWDDLTYSSSNDSLVAYRNLNGTGFQRMELFPFTTDAKQPTWVDYDNDGDADIMWSKRSNGTKLWRNDGNMNFTDVTASLNMPTNGPRHGYGYSWGDYDKDGWLDVYVCLYNSEPFIRNYLLHNNGNGTFTNLASSAGVDVGAYLSLQSAWIDVNEDGWPDLYVINEGQENHLFINDGDGTFTNMAAAAGVLANIQSMTNSWNDYDHDGDWDVYITEALFGNILFQNNGNGTFTNVAAAAGVTVGSYCWGAQWIDIDHDTWDDLHVTTATNILNQDFFYTNNGDGTFTNALLAVFSQDFNFTYASAKGDFNHDGYWDMSVTRVGTTSYQLLEGIAGDNNWVKLSLEGTHSNRDAIGSKIDYFIGNTHLMKYTKCGENYLSQNSQHEILSMGSVGQIDSLIITWPRGLVERFYNIQAGEWLELVEGENTNIEVTYIGASTICPEQFARIDAGAGASYLWNTDEVSRTIDVTNPGSYSVEVTDINGYVFSAEIEVTQQAAWNVTETVEQISCSYNQDGFIDISSEQVGSILWNDGNQGSMRDNLEAGIYQYTLISNAGCIYSSEIEIIAPDAPVINEERISPLCFNSGDGQINILIENQQATILWNDNNQSFSRNDLIAESYHYIIQFDECSYNGEVILENPQEIMYTLDIENISCFGLEDGAATFDITGGTGLLEVMIASGMSGALALGVHAFEITDQNDCSVFGEFEINEPEVITYNLSTENVSCFGFEDGEVLIDVSGGTGISEIIVSAQNISSLAAAYYTFEIIDQNNCSVFGEFEITEPSELIATVEITHADNGPNGTATVSVEGGSEPYGYLWSNESVNAEATGLVQGTYTCEVTDDNGCTTVVEANIIDVKVSEIVNASWKVYPNPTNDFLRIEGTDSGKILSVSIYNLQGSLVRIFNSLLGTTLILDLTNLASGEYCLSILSETGGSSQMIVVR